MKKRTLVYCTSLVVKNISSVFSVVPCVCVLAVLCSHCEFLKTFLLLFHHLLLLLNIPTFLPLVPFPPPSPFNMLPLLFFFFFLTMLPFSTVLQAMLRLNVSLGEFRRTCVFKTGVFTVTISLCSAQHTN